MGPRGRAFPGSEHHGSTFQGPLFAAGCRGDRRNDGRRHRRSPVWSLSLPALAAGTAADRGAGDLHARRGGAPAGGEGRSAGRALDRPAEPLLDRLGRCRALQLRPGPRGGADPPFPGSFRRLLSLRSVRRSQRSEIHRVRHLQGEPGSRGPDRLSSRRHAGTATGSR